MVWWHVVVFGFGVFSVLLVVLWLFMRSLDKPGGRDGLGTMGNSMGMMDQFFSPSKADATAELEAQKSAQVVIPSAGDDDDRRHGHVDFHPDGRVRSIRIHRPRD